jgi:hypothetical protein
MHATNGQQGATTSNGLLSAAVSREVQGAHEQCVSGSSGSSASGGQAVMPTCGLGDGEEIQGGFSVAAAKTGHAALCGPGLDVAVSVNHGPMIGNDGG